MGKCKQLVFSVGTRPDIIKMSRLIALLDGYVLHTGQHYSEEVDSSLLQELGVKVDHRIKADGEERSSSMRSVAEETAFYLQSLAPVGVAVVYGDTLSAMMTAVGARMAGWQVAHVEAGLRSFDMTMPEEVARRTIDALSSRLYAPTELQAEFLRQEGVNGGKVLVSGNVIVDVLRNAKEQVTHEERMYSTQIAAGHKYAVCTLHRPENVDFDEAFRRVLRAVIVVAVSQGLKKVILPVHPRAKERAERLLENAPSREVICMVAPVGYSQMVALLQGSEFVITDSGGLQEEAALLARKCITIRKSTERQETLNSGHNVLLSPHTHEEPELLIRAMEHLQKPPPGPIDCYGDAPSKLVAEDLTRLLSALQTSASEV